ncbi:MAG TPA: AMP-binding protein, partial [Quisquiliibacterium sp.]|nr:AMP-binding protein [Quisquiliibacterium sp.]
MQVKPVHLRTRGRVAGVDSLPIVRMIVRQTGAGAGEVMGEQITDHEAARRSFCWSLPQRFNFGRDVVDAHAARRPGAPALIWCDEAGNERRYTFDEIRRLSNRCANLLAGMGVKRGDRVIVMLPRLPQWQIAM